MTNLQYNEDYYQLVVKQYGYNPIDFDTFKFNIGALSYQELNLRYLCHQNADKYVSVPQEKRIVITGFGMSGIPHLGSISQIIRMIKLQQSGENCEIILGDLDAYNGRNVPISKSRELASKFKVFINALGFKESSTGKIRIQYDSPYELLNSYLLARYSTEDNLDRYEEDIHDLYVSKGVVGRSLNYTRRTSLMLMVSDFISAGQKYDAVMGIIGIDEHKYVLYAKEIQSRVEETKSGLRSDFIIASIYNRLNKGFGGYPKMSKSFPDSGIKVDDSSEKISNLIMAEEDHKNPYESLVFQLMVQLHYFKQSELNEVISKYTKRPQWKKMKVGFVEYLVDISNKWPKN